MLPNLNSDEVLICKVNVCLFTENKQLLNSLWLVLNEDEKDRAPKFKTIKLHDKFIISRGILRYILGYYISLPPQNVEFAYNKFGKPILKNSCLEFNISHSNDMIVYAISLKYKVGIDIEFVNNQIDVVGISNLILTNNEVQLLNEIEGKDKYLVFYRIWTIKESLVKAIGIGLSYPINKINSLSLITTNETNIILNFDYKKYRLYYHSLEITENYIASLSIENKMKKINYLDINNDCIYKLLTALLS